MMPIDIMNLPLEVGVIIAVFGNILRWAGIVGVRIADRRADNGRRRPPIAKVGCGFADEIRLALWNEKSACNQGAQRQTLNQGFSHNI